ncbi:13521_t:CDS:2 [Rhizophagus irregularis]|nr:13521_t:CDS:2 [Rhizophagus irregularis]
MTPSDMLEVYIQDELNSLNFMPNKIHIIAIDYTTPTIAPEKKIWVCYDRCPIAFSKEELESKGICDVDDLKREIRDRLSSLSNYTNDMLSLRKKNETEILAPTISIDNLYSMEFMELDVIVDKENYRPNKKVKLEEAKKVKKIWVYYEEFSLTFRKEDCDSKGIYDVDGLRREIKDSFNTLSDYSYEMVFLRNRNETEFLDPAISIDVLYGMKLEVIIVNKKNDNKSTSSRKKMNNIESKRIEKAFQTKYQGTVLEKFYIRLNFFHEIWLSDSRYVPYLAIIQSSGSGKTRLVAELRTKGIYVLYICKRSEDSTGYPKSTPFAQKVLDTIRDDEFGALLCGAIEEIKNKGWSAEEFWDIQVKGDHECEEFWNVVLGSLDLESSQSKCNNEEFVKDLFPQIGISVVCCIDEAHELITQRNSGETCFVKWRRQIKKISWKGFFNVVLSTNGKIGNFLPPTIKDTVSARTTNFQIFPAYLDVSTTDVLALLVENVGKENFDKDYDLKRAVYLGTPLWGSLAQAGESLKDLILLASEKIRNFSKKKDDYIANLACISCTLALEVSPRIAEVDNLIASHMATAIGISPDRTSILCTYPSDAILASGALKGIINVGWENCLDTLVELLSRGVVEVGERGELVNRILFLMRYAVVAREIFLGSATYLEKIPLKLFLEKIDGHSMLLDELKINDAKVGFNHWISLLATNMDYVNESEGNKFLTEDLVKEAYHRHAAIRMPFGFKDIDHVIPFKYSSDYGVILIQNKNAKQSTYKSVDNFALTNPASVGIRQKDYKVLGIYADFHQGELPYKATSEIKSIDYISTRSRPGEKANIMYIRGVEAFEFDNEINKRLFKVLYTRPWPLDRYWSTFGENELVRKDEIKSFLPIIFKQNKGESLIDKWKM